MMHWSSIAPELYYFFVVLAMLGLSLRRRQAVRPLYFAALFLAGLGIVICLAAVHRQALLFAGTYRVDLFAQVFKVLLGIGFFLVVFLCSDLAGIPSRRHPEFYLLLATSTLAMMFLVSSVHLLTIYVSLELSSYSLYVLVVLRRDRSMGIEAGIKYFMVGVIASAVMLFGIALLYGALHSAAVAELSRTLPGAIDRPVVLIGLVLALSGFFFKLAVFPFHIWAPDTFQGAANEVAAYIATASKVAAVAILIRIVSLSGGHSAQLAHILVVLSILSMTVGNLAAIVQNDLKRMLAYSSIAHAGYVLIGILSMNTDGYAAAVFYALAVLLMKFTCFLVVVKAASRGGNVQIAHLAGLHRRSPMLAMALMLALFGLAGIPPTIGFTGKLLVFTAAIEQGYLWLVIVAMINVVISLYYYLLVVKAAYLVEPEGPSPAIAVSLADNLMAAGLVAGMVVMGIYPAGIIQLARTAVAHLL